MNVCGLSNPDFEKTKIRLLLLREQLAELNLDAFIVPSSDEHLGEYSPAEEERLKWLTGFTGSAGMCIVLKSEAAIFVDGRYTIQVRQQLPAETFEFKHVIEDSAVQWLLEKLKLDHVKILMNLKVFSEPTEKVNQSLSREKLKDLGKKMSRNEPCHCGSGKKFKKCCGAL